MSGGASCQCPKGTRSVLNWCVTQYKCNHSAFNGYHRTPSDYSTVRCYECGATWRTMAAFVDTLPGSSQDDFYEEYHRRLDARSQP